MKKKKKKKKKKKWQKVEESKWTHISYVKSKFHGTNFKSQFV